MPVTADGLLVAVRMGSHTVNAGRVHFAAGSFEPEDLGGGRVDVAGNMAREVAEETGLRLTGLPSDPGYHAHSGAMGTVVFRRFLLPDPADTIAARIDALAAADPHAEIAGAVVIRSADDAPEGLMPHMGMLIRWHFARRWDDAKGLEDR